MKKKPSRKKGNDSEDELKNWLEWQEHQYSPGYYIGTGRPLRPISNLKRYPYAMIIGGILFIVSTIISVYHSGFWMDNFIITLISLILSVSLIYTGLRILKSKKK